MPRGSNLISVRGLCDILADLKIIARTGQSTPSKLLTSTSSSSSSTPFLLFDATLDGAEAFKSRRIPGALFWDFNACRDVTSGLTRTVPPPHVFEDYLQAVVGGKKWGDDESGNNSNINQKFDEVNYQSNNSSDGNNNNSKKNDKSNEDNGPFINSSTLIVAYDGFAGFNGFRCAPRLWWLFKYFGHERVRVLDGGLDEWLKMGGRIYGEGGGGGGDAEVDEFPVEDGYETRTFPMVANHRKIFEANPDLRLFTSYGNVLSEVAAVPRRDPVLVDVRLSKDFNDAHCLTAVNYPLKSMIDEQKGILKSTKELAKDFADLGVHFDVQNKAAAAAESTEEAPAKKTTPATASKAASMTPVIATCYLGQTACALSLAASLVAEEAGVELNASVYDGSWEEWKIKGGPMEGETVGVVEEKKEEAKEEEKVEEGKKESAAKDGEKK